MLSSFHFLTKLSTRSLLLSLTSIIGTSGLLLWSVGSFFSLHTVFVAYVGALQYISFGVALYVVARRAVGLFQTFALQEKIIAVSILTLWIWLGIGILLPEIGFDALWYHLPIAHDVVETGRVSVIPDLYQSLQPKLGAMLFVPSLQFFGTTGVKVFVYYMSTVFVLLLYQLARNYLNRLYALLCVLIVMSLHTVSWQSSSAYVDIIRAVFEVSAILLIIGSKKTHSFSLTDVGITFFLLCFLLTKSVSLLFLLPYVFLLLRYKGIAKAMLLSSAAIILFLFSQMNGNQIPLLSFYSQVSNELIGTSKGAVGWLQWGMGRFTTFVSLPLWLSFHRESYTTPVFLLSLPFLMVSGKKLWNLYKAEVLYVLASLGIWCVVVPISVRYGLVAIIFYLFFCLFSLAQHAKHYPKLQVLLIVIVLFGAVWTASVRGYVYFRALAYLTNSQTEIEYVSQFKDGINTGPIEDWYGQ